MEFTIDISFLEFWIGKNPFWIFAQVLRYGGWIPLAFTFLWGFWRVWLSYIRGKYVRSVEYILLAIDVPKENKQGPKAVEQLFSHLHGIKEKKDWIKRNLQGYIQPGFSLEIISIDGYIQFLIRTPVEFRDLVEAAVYAQYPDAEITEIEDYTRGTPEEFPDETYDLWGAEFALYNRQVYPIRTYPSFEDPTAMERFKDPMSSILEILSKLQKGERAWIQIIIVPAEDDWKIEGQILARKLAGEKAAPEKMVSEKLIEKIGELAPPWPEARVPEKREPIKLEVFTPGQRRVIEAVQNKISKLGFHTKIRIIYLAKKEIFYKPRGVVSVLGAFNQFNTLDMNGFKTDPLTKTKEKHWWAELRWPFWLSPLQEFHQKQNKVLRNYKYRDSVAGAASFILNTEELATIFHFPVSTVEAPMVKKTGSRRAEPPFALPVEEEEVLPIRKEVPSKKAPPPPELPTEE